MTTGELRIVLTTVSSHEDAVRIARRMVESHLCACVNIVPGVQSIYWWNDALQDEAEELLIIKTSSAALERLETELLAAHPYEVPELVVISPSDVAPPYLQWILNAVGR